MVVDHQCRFISVPDEELVGVRRADEDTTGDVVVKEFLLKGEPRRSVIWVVGMGGISKTTLASRLYNSDAAVKYFEFRAWIVVSDQFTERYILEQIARQVFLQQWQETMGIVDMEELVKGR